jgi:hypothetical protein
VVLQIDPTSERAEIVKKGSIIHLEVLGLVEMHARTDDDLLLLYLDATEEHFYMLASESFAKPRAIRYAFGDVIYDKFVIERGSFFVERIALRSRPDRGWDLAWSEYHDGLRKGKYLVRVRSFSEDGERVGKSKTLMQMSDDGVGAPEVVWLPNGSLQVWRIVSMRLEVWQLARDGTIESHFSVDKPRGCGTEVLGGDGFFRCVNLDQGFPQRGETQVMRWNRFGTGGSSFTEASFSRGAFRDETLLPDGQSFDDCVYWLSLRDGHWRRGSLCRPEMRK